MHESCLKDVVVALDELPHDLHHLEIGKGFALFEEGVEISFAEFSDYIGVVFGGVDVVQVQDVTGTCEGTEGSDLELKQHLIDGVFEFGHLYDFDADLVAVLVVDAFVDCAAVALANVLVHSVGVPLNRFHC